MADKNVIVLVKAVDAASKAFQKVASGVKELKKETKEAQQSAQGAESAFLGMAKNLGRGLLAGGLIAATAAVVELGGEVKAIDEAFKVSIATIGDYESIMTSLRASTHNLVDDLTLQKGALLLSEMGLAKTEDEMARLTEMAVTLGRAMGEDAASSIDNFARMLANQSVQRLDSFGISSGRVGQRIEELLEAGEALNREDAFKMAVLEIGAQKVEMMSEALENSYTSIDEFRVRISNMVQDVTTEVARLADEFAGHMLNTIDTISWSVGELTKRGATVGDLAIGIFNPDYLTETVRQRQLEASLAQAREVVRRSGIDANLPEDFAIELGALIVEQLRELDAETAKAALRDQKILDAFLDSAFLNTRMTVEDLRRYFGLAIGQEQAVIDGVRQIAVSYGSAIIDSRAQIDEALAFARNVEAIKPMVQTGGASAQDMLAVASPEDVERARELGVVRQRARGIEGVGSDIQQRLARRETGLFTDDELLRAQTMLNQVDAIIAQLEEGASMGLVEESELERARDMRDSIAQMVDEIKEGNEEWEKMAGNLDALLGRNMGDSVQSLIGQIGDVVIELIDDEAMADEIVSAFNLASGRETELGLLFENELAPTIAAIAEQFGADAAIAASERLAEALQSGTLAGLSGAAMESYLINALGFRLGEDGLERIRTTTSTGGAQLAASIEGEYLGAPDAYTVPMTLDDVKLTLQDVNLQLQTTDDSANNVKDTMAGWQEPLQVATDMTLNLRGELEDLKDTKWTLTLHLELDPESQALVSSLRNPSAGTLADTLDRAVRNRGGVGFGASLSNGV